MQSMVGNKDPMMFYAVRSNSLHLVGSMCVPRFAALPESIFCFAPIKICMLI